LLALIEETICIAGMGISSASNKEYLDSIIHRGSRLESLIAPQIFGVVSPELFDTLEPKLMGVFASSKG
jgi:hypothetical protein